MKKYIVEACVESVAASLLAEQRGADRIELCADLLHDGLTPSLEVIEEAAARLTIPMRVMIRPHARDFHYDVQELKEMKRVINQCKLLDVEGVVFGMTEAGSARLDLHQIASLVDCAAPLKVTIHKAIDACERPLEEVARILQLGNIDAVLTSGGAETALAGVSMLREMIAMAGDQLDIIACGRVTDQNIDSMHALLRAKVYHGRKIVGSLA